LGMGLTRSFSHRYMRCTKIASTSIQLSCSQSWDTSRVI
jgi:hypothetical protein